MKLVLMSHAQLGKALPRVREVGKADCTCVSVCERVCERVCGVGWGCVHAPGR